jgi:hypothetical protein
MVEIAQTHMSKMLRAWILKKFREKQALLRVEEQGRMLERQMKLMGTGGGGSDDATSMAQSNIQTEMDDE